MAIWPFGRKKQEDLEAVPTEIQEYYQAEQRERMGVAWLLAFVTLIVTVGVVLGLFFGGRWAYRKLANKDKDNKGTVAVQPQAPSTPTETPKPAESNKTSSNNQPTTPPATSTPSSPSPAPSTPSNNQPATPQTSSNSSNLPHTGPADNLAIFVVAVGVGTGAYQLHLRRKSL